MKVPETPEANGANKGVGIMHFDMRLVGGILVGLVLGLNYHPTLEMYLPIFTVAALIVGIQLVRR